MFKTALLIVVFLFQFQFQAFAAINIDRVWDWDNPNKSEQMFAKLADEAKQNQDIDFYLQLLTQVARAQGLQEKFDQANATLDLVQSELSETTPTAKIRYYLERGRVFNSSEQPEKAVPLFTTAFELASTHNDDLAIDAAHMMGIALPDFNQQVEWDMKALEIMYNSNDPTVKSWIVPLYNNMSWSLYDGKRFEEALTAFTKYAEILRTHGMEPDQEVLDTIEILKKQLGQ